MFCSSLAWEIEEDEDEEEDEEDEGRGVGGSIKSSPLSSPKHPSAPNRSSGNGSRKKEAEER